MTQTKLFAEKYLGSIFYFCLKKTGDQTQAEELSGDIAFAVVDSLAKYPPPEHRELVVAHYIDSVGIGELSTRTGLPSGAIKTRLFKARKILKEGMDMAREFGKRSYNPETIRFCASGSQPDGLPWSAVQRKIPVNILLEASKNLSTAEELSMELGIALPYMEEEISILERATLLEKVGDKYVTSFFIADKEVQLEIYNSLRCDSKERSRLLAEAVGDNYAKIRELVQPTCGEVDFKWFLYVWLIDGFINKLDAYNIWNVFKRPNGGNWGFCGYENHDWITENTFVNHNLCGNDKIATLG